VVTLLKNVCTGIIKISHPKRVPFEKENIIFYNSLLFFIVKFYLLKFDTNYVFGHKYFEQKFEYLPSFCVHYIVRTYKTHLVGEGAGGRWALSYYNNKGVTDLLVLSIYTLHTAFC